MPTISLTVSPRLKVCCVFFLRRSRTRLQRAISARWCLVPPRTLMPFLDVPRGLTGHPAWVSVGATKGSGFFCIIYCWDEAFVPTRHRVVRLAAGRQDDLSLQNLCSIHPPCSTHVLYAYVFIHIMPIPLPGTRIPGMGPHAPQPYRMGSGLRGCSCGRTYRMHVQNVSSISV